jgi:hypothetical protein
MEYGGLNKLSEDTYKDEKQAKYNLQLVLLNQPAPVSKYTNFPVHIKVFTDYTKNPEYRDKSLDVRGKIDAYIGDCNLYLQQQIIQQQQTMGGMPQPPQPQMGPGNQKKQMQTGTEKKEASAARSQATGQPGANIGASPQAPQGV